MRARRGNTNALSLMANHKPQKEQSTLQVHTILATNLLPQQEIEVFLLAWKESSQ